MRARTRFHRNDTAWVPDEELQHLPAPQALADHSTSGLIRTVDLERAFRKIEPDHGHFAHQRIPSCLAGNPPWHNDAVGGRLQHQSRIDTVGEGVHIIRVPKHQNLETFSQFYRKLDPSADAPRPFIWNT